MRRHLLLLMIISFTITIISCKKEINLPTVLSIDVTDVTSLGATSGGNITDDGGAEISERGVVWCNSESPTISNNLGMTNDGAGKGSFVSEINELEPETTYFVRAYATNSEGTGYGDVISFTTLSVEPDVELPAVETIEASNIQINSATIGGEVTNDGGAEVTSRGLVWSTDENPSLDNNMGFTEEGTGIGNFESEITELSPSTQYYYKAYATNSEGTAYGEQMSFISLEEESQRIPCPGISQVTDIDGNTYNTVLVEDQCWIAENLRTTKYNDNIDIENLTSNDDWINTTSGAYVWFNNNIENKEIYGALYNFFAITNGKLCPEGWRVATDNDWKALEGHHDSEFEPESSEWNNQGWRGSDAGHNLKSKDSWIGTGNGNDIYVFTVLPAGQRNATTGVFERAGEWGMFWSDKNGEEDEVFRRYLNQENNNIARYNSNPRSGYSVRCIKNGNLLK